MARTLQAAYADGLLSDQTLANRLELLLGSTVLDPARLIADLQGSKGRKALARLRDRCRRRPTAPGILLALDWSGADRELLIGRDLRCDVRLDAATVSRQHARLVFRDAGWIVQDLESLNGTMVNGVQVGRCRLRPGDRLIVADQPLRVD